PDRPDHRARVSRSHEAEWLMRARFGPISNRSRLKHRDQSSPPQTRRLTPLGPPLLAAAAIAQLRPASLRKKRADAIAKSQKNEKPAFTKNEEFFGIVKWRGRQAQCFVVPLWGAPAPPPLRRNYKPCLSTRSLFTSPEVHHA